MHTIFVHECGKIVMALQDNGYFLVLHRLPKMEGYYSFTLADPQNVKIIYTYEVEEL